MSRPTNILSEVRITEKILAGYLADKGRYPQILPTHNSPPKALPESPDRLSDAPPDFPSFEGLVEEYGGPTDRVTVRAPKTIALRVDTYHRPPNQPMPEHDALITLFDENESYSYFVSVGQQTGKWVPRVDAE